MDFFREKVAQVQLTKKEALVADYILNNSNKVCFMSATELAAALDISDNTINRLAKSIGYPSYLELQKQIREHVSHRIENAQRFLLNPLERMFLAGRSANTPDSSFEAQFLEKSFQSLQDCFRNNAPDKLEKVLSLFLNSQVKYIGGQRPTAALAEKFGFILRMILSNVLVLKDEYSFEKIIDIGPKDLFFLIDFNPYSRSAKRLLQYAQERKAQIVLLTDQFTSPLAHYATEVLVVDVNGFSFFNSNISAQALLEYLCTRLAERASQTAEQRLNLLNPYFDSHKLSSGKANE